MKKAYIVLKSQSQVMLEQTFIENYTNKYDILLISDENIFHDVSNDFFSDFVFYMLMIFFVKNW
jgi:hypothetical protein